VETAVMSVLPEERVLTTLHTVALAVQSLQRMGVAADSQLVLSLFCYESPALEHQPAAGCGIS